MLQRFGIAIVAVVGLTGFCLPAIADVAFVAVLKVPEANKTSFDELAMKMIEVSRQDPGLLIYEFAWVGDKVYGYERYNDEAAHERHQTLIEPFLPDLLELAEFEKIITMTDISNDVRPGFEAMGALIGEPIGGVPQGKLGE